MTVRQFVKDVMDYVRERTKTLGEQEYDNFLEQLIFEMEDERQQLNWTPETEE